MRLGGRSIPRIARRADANQRDADLRGSFSSPTFACVSLGRVNKGRGELGLLLQWPLDRDKQLVRQSKTLARAERVLARRRPRPREKPRRPRRLGQRRSRRRRIWQGERQRCARKLKPDTQPDYPVSRDSSRHDSGLIAAPARDLRRLTSSVVRLTSTGGSPPTNASRVNRVFSRF